MTQTGTKSLIVGTRKSELAMQQTHSVIAQLKQLHPELDISIVSMTTTGDRNLTQSLPTIGDKALFTKELENALLAGDVDVVVHSLKDLPTTLPDGLTIGAILSREDPRDVLVCKSKYAKGTKLCDLPNGAIIGTSSWRRTAQLKRLYPYLTIKSIVMIWKYIDDQRGNLNTRLRKLEEEDYDAIVLACAGIKRLGWEDKISVVLDDHEMFYAVGQGALAVECRRDDVHSLSLLKHLNDIKTSCSCRAERAFLKSLEGGCSVPIGVCTTLKMDELILEGALFSLDGTQAIHSTQKMSINLENISQIDIESLGRRVALEIIENGGLKVLEDVKAAKIQK